MFAAEWWWQGVWHSLPFIAWDLSMQPRTKIWFFNQFIRIRACACSSNLNYAQKCIENSINASKCPNKPTKIPKIDTTLLLFLVDTTLLLFLVDTRKNLKAIRGNGYRPVTKGDTFPIETTMLVVRSLYLNLPQMGQNFHHGMLIPLHDSMPSFMNFRRVLDLLEFKN